MPFTVGCVRMIRYLILIVSLDDVDTTVARLRAESVKILEPMKAKNGFKHAFIDGPDFIRIELLEK